MVREDAHRGASAAQRGPVLLYAIVGAAAGAVATAMILRRAPRRDDDDPFYQPLA
jgi:hypothetical protein